jgi:hypothetical protein
MSSCNVWLEEVSSMLHRGRLGNAYGWMDPGAASALTNICWKTNIPYFSFLGRDNSEKYFRPSPKLSQCT